MNIKQKKGSLVTAVLVGLLLCPAMGAEPTPKVNLNTATPSQLDSLPGIGPVIAERIIRFREDNGPFKRNEDLMNVRGIGEKTYLKLKDEIIVETIEE
jgi:competence protein ComEA